MAKVTEEQAQDFVYLRRQGQSYSSIGKKYEIDARTVKARIHKIEEAGRREHWTAVSRLVDAKYLDEHYQLLAHVALGILRTVRSEPLFGPSGQDPEQLLIAFVDYRLTEFAADLLDRRGIDIRPKPQASSPDEIGEPAGMRMARKLGNCLLEHEPVLQTALDEWKNHWARFQHRRSALINEAENLLKQRKLEEEVAKKLGQEVVAGILKSQLAKEQIRSTRIEIREEEAAALLIDSYSGTQEICAGSEQEMRTVLEAYGFVTRQVSLNQRVQPVSDVYESLKQSVNRVEDLIDHMTLKGRPDGRCALCPDQPLIESGSRSSLRSQSDYFAAPNQLL